MRAAFEVFVVFLRLGLSSFGGPVAHLGYFRDAFVTRLKWLDEAAYADLVALCQFLPGPASSQVGFAIGLKRGGALGGLAAWLGFTAPSAALMLLAANGARMLDGAAAAAVVHGLKLVAVAIVAHAVFNMARTLLRELLHRTLAAGAALILMMAALPQLAPLLIICSGAIGMIANGPVGVAPMPVERMRLLHAWPAWVAFAGVVTFALAGAEAFRSPLLQIAAVMARAGALVFGGGHAVLPLLDAEVVGRGWIGENTFLAGYGAAQALPGPLFSFAAFVGAASGQSLAGGLVALVAIFLPGLLLVALALPWWERLKRQPRAVGFVGGASAAVVGVLAAALWDPVIVSAVKRPQDGIIAAAGFVALQWLKAPAWLVVVLVGAAGAGAAMLA